MRGSRPASRGPDPAVPKRTPPLRFAPCTRTSRPAGAPSRAVTRASTAASSWPSRRPASTAGPICPVRGPKPRARAVLSHARPPPRRRASGPAAAAGRRRRPARRSGSAAPRSWCARAAADRRRLPRHAPVADLARRGARRRAAAAPAVPAPRRRAAAPRGPHAARRAGAPAARRHRPAAGRGGQRGGLRQPPAVRRRDAAPTYGRSPGELRRRPARRAAAAARSGLTLRLAFRPPFDWDALLDYFASRAIPGVEAVEGGRYRRVARAGEQVGVVEVERLRGPRRGARCTWRRRSFSATVAVAARVRHLLDLDCDPLAVAAVLGDDPHLGRLLAPPARAAPAGRLGRLRGRGARDGRASR